MGAHRATTSKNIQLLKRFFIRNMISVWGYRFRLVIIFLWRYFRYWRHREQYLISFKRSMAVTGLLNPRTLQHKLAAQRRNAHSDNKVFFIIQFDKERRAGFFAIISNVLYHCAYAVAKGYIPVVDLQNFQNMYLDEENLGKENSWEYYFKQPYNYNLKDVSRCECAKGKGIWTPTVPDYTFNGFHNRKILLRFWNTMYREFVKLNEPLQRHIDEEYSKLIKPGQRVLGVCCRGTDYTANRPFMHPIQPDIDTIVEKTKQCLADWKCEMIFLATEDAGRLAAFKKAFPDKVITSSQVYHIESDCKDTWLADIKCNRENDSYLRGVEYITTILILSKCNCLLAGRAGGSVAAMYINGGKYEHKYFFELGEYGIDDSRPHESAL